MSAEVTVTIKGGGGHGDPWVVVRGSVADVFGAVVTAFGFDEQQVAGLSLAEVTRTAADHFAGVGAVAVDLGGRVMTPAEEQAEPAQQYETPGEDPWEDVAVAGQPDKDWPATKEPENPHAALIAAINAAESLEAIQRLWLKNQDAFGAPAVQTAVAARREALGA